MVQTESVLIPLFYERRSSTTWRESIGWSHVLFMMDHDSFQLDHCLAAWMSCGRFYYIHYQFSAASWLLVWLWYVVEYHWNVGYMSLWELGCSGIGPVDGLVKRQWQTVRLPRANDTSDKTRTRVASSLTICRWNQEISLVFS